MRIKKFPSKVIKKNIVKFANSLIHMRQSCLIWIYTVYSLIIKFWITYSLDETFLKFWRCSSGHPIFFLHFKDYYYTSTKVLGAAELGCFCNWAWLQKFCDFWLKKYCDFWLKKYADFSLKNNCDLWLKKYGDFLHWISPLSVIWVRSQHADLWQFILLLCWWM